jgi:phenylalanyl-tRNA synthetase beta chain
MKISYEWVKEYVGIKVSPDELALGLTMSGSEVDSIDDVGSDKIMELEITSNRPDCLNMLGIAREASAVFDVDLNVPSVRDQLAGVSNDSKVKCVIKDKKLCPAYTARVITGVNIKPAPGKIVKRLEALGLRTVNNVVDITNYCLMGSGQPLHAFDLDKLTGGKLIIRKAQKDEKLTTIDGVCRSLDTDMLVIADAQKPVAIAGVMGGIDTEVTNSTKNVLLESAYFDPLSIRRTARKLGISTDASYRFERGVDKGMVLNASDMAAALIIEEAGGELGSFHEEGALKLSEPVIEFDCEKAGKVLGAELKKEWVKRIFTRLGMTIVSEKGNLISVKVPTFREDIREEVDLLEEAARIYGYDKIPGTMPAISPAIQRKDTARLAAETLSEALVGAGFFEIMTYSLISDSSAERFTGVIGDPVVLSNPLSEEQKVLVPQLIDGMLKSISWNINRRNKDLMLFEMGKVYSKALDGNGYLETPVLCIGITGLANSDWARGTREIGFYDLKGSIEEAFRTLKIVPEFSSSKLNEMSICADVRLKGSEMQVGYAGRIKDKFLAAYDIEQEVYVAQIRLDSVFKEAVLSRKYHSVSRFPFSARDISILCDEAICAADISQIIGKSGSELIRKIDLIDVYRGKNIPAGKKSLTYSILYGLDTRTLKDEEIESIHADVKDALTGDLGVTFR